MSSTMFLRNPGHYLAPAAVPIESTIHIASYYFKVSYVTKIKITFISYVYTFNYNS